MSVERWYVPIPEESPVLRRSLIDPAYGDYLALPWLFGPRSDTPSRSAEEADFLTDIALMNSARSGQFPRPYTLDQDFDALHFLLSPARRDGRTDADDAGTRAIRGARPLPDHLRGGQGHPIRHSTVDDVRLIVGSLDRITPDDLRRMFDPVRMEAECVYKFWADRVEPRSLTDLIVLFDGLLSFYREVAARGEGVLAVVT